MEPNMTKRITLRCYAKREANVFLAICIDLGGLAAQGDSLDEAKTKLQAQIRDYISEIESEPRYARQLLSRKSPLLHRIQYHMADLLQKHRIKSTSNSNTETCKFSFDKSVMV